MPEPQHGRNPPCRAGIRELLCAIGMRPQRRQEQHRVIGEVVEQVVHDGQRLAVRVVQILKHDNGFLGGEQAQDRLGPHHGRIRHPGRLFRVMQAFETHALTNPELSARLRRGYDELIGLLAHLLGSDRHARELLALALGLAGLTLTGTLTPAAAREIVHTRLGEVGDRSGIKKH